MKQAGEYLVPRGEDTLTRAYEIGGVDTGILAQCLGRFDGRFTAVDGGAHAGSWSRYMAGRFKFVFAFEPEPMNHKCLWENTRELPNVVRLQAALWDAPEIPVQMEQRRVGNTGTFQVKTLEASPRHAGPFTTTIDLKLADSPHQVDFIKLDVEGAELHALRGAVQTIERCKPAILFEWAAKTAGRYGTKLEDIEDFLRGHGYAHAQSYKENYLWLA